eukprot:6137936-Pleurochrysis_carterae.AAC.1
MAFCRVNSSSSSPAAARRIRSSIRAVSSYNCSELVPESAPKFELELVPRFAPVLELPTEPRGAFRRIVRLDFFASSCDRTRVVAFAASADFLQSRSWSRRIRFRIIRSSDCSAATGVPKSWHIAPRYLQSKEEQMLVKEPVKNTGLKHSTLTWTATRMQRGHEFCTASVNTASHAETYQGDLYSHTKEPGVRMQDEGSRWAGASRARCQKTDRR